MTARSFLLQLNVSLSQPKFTFERLKLSFLISVSGIQPVMRDNSIS